eukprot:TRINITY_DN45567_c0_g1_i1.p1 TRINITY_DN45567_c0_g1~~TRINITY_DN45567_c0_g1_i1.p1  ORF type:complete len:384 (-),score=28.61 TRINITY_DN45567_c0_g1_i1:34-1185(-)
MSSLWRVLSVQEHADFIIAYLELYEGFEVLAACKQVAAIARPVCSKRAEAVQLYVYGGSTSRGDDVSAVVYFTPATGQWKELPSLPESRIPVLVEVGGCLYAGSAEDDDWDGSVLRFDVAARNWLPMPPLIIPRTGYKLIGASGRLFVCGGICEASDDSVPCTSEFYDSEAALWVPVQPENIQKCRPLIVQESNFIYMCATVGDDDIAPSTVKSLDSVTGVWKNLPLMLERDVSRCLLFMHSSCGSIYVGSDESIQRFDVLSQRWEKLPPMPDALSHYDSCEIAYQGCLYVCGGSDDDQMSQRSFGRFCPKKHSWDILSSLPIPRSHPAMVGFGGHVYVLGGCQESTLSCRSVFRFSLRHGQWEDVLPMPSAKAEPEILIKCT